MRIEIDQSWKLEDTSKPTVIAFSSRNKSESIYISSKDKKRLQDHYRKCGKHKIYAYKTFAILIYLLIKDYLSEIDGIEVDTEYLGKENLIKDFLLEFIWRTNPRFDKNLITFRRVTKGSDSHKEAISVFRKKHQPTKTVALREIKKRV